MLRVFYPVLVQLRKILTRIEEFEGGGAWRATLSDDLPLGHGPRRCHLHYKAAGRDDNKAPDGGFSGPENAQHGAVN